MIDLKVGSLYRLKQHANSTVRKAFYGHLVKLIKQDNFSYAHNVYCVVQLVTIPDSENQSLKGVEVRLSSEDLEEYQAESNEEGLKLLNQEEF
jgi:hypothetical protein